VSSAGGNSGYLGAGGGGGTARSGIGNNCVSANTGAGGGGGAGGTNGDVDPGDLAPTYGRGAAGEAGIVVVISYFTGNG
jgi:hypothetical protein